MDVASPATASPERPAPATSLPATPPLALDPYVQHFVETRRIIDVVSTMALSADAGDWAALRGCMADTIFIDYTSLAGGEPGEMPADNLVEQWKFLAGFRATQHMIANHRVTWHGDSATCMAYVVAHHYLPNDGGGAFWRLGGRYHFELERAGAGWGIRQLTLTVLWTEGNADLLPLAEQRYREQTCASGASRHDHPGRCD